MINVEKEFEEYITNYSKEQMAISLKTARIILKCLGEQHPRRIADVGSGFSSFVIAKWCNENGAKLDVFDESPKWLDVTKRFLRANGMNANYFPYSEFDCNKYDFIFFDICGDNRIKELGQFEHCSAFILLDDCQRKEYIDFLNDHGCYVIKFDYEADNYGRYCGIVKNRLH